MLHIIMEVYMKKFGFTLAEVLVTLGVIGVIAALTLPSLIANYEKKVYATSLKKDYTLIMNAFQKAMVDGESFDDFEKTELADALKSDDINIAQNEINKYFRNAKVSQYNRNNYTYTRINGKNYPSALSSHIKYRIDLPGFTFWVVGPYYGIMELSIDVNGADKKPNISGKDFYFVKLNKRLKLDEPWYALWRSNNKHNTYTDCTNSQPEACFYTIMVNDNWEIKYY